MDVSGIDFGAGSLVRDPVSDGGGVSGVSEGVLDGTAWNGQSFAGSGGPSNDGQELADLIVRLNSQFEDDIGLFVVFFVNYVKLEVGEALFLRADDIHAYLSGDIIECMASSDNVVRAGFTPKYKDIKTLTTMLTYNYAPIAEQKMAPPAYPYVTLNREAYWNPSGNVNFQNNIRKGDTSYTPLQFVYEASDCRFFYTPQMIVDQSKVWSQVYNAETIPWNVCPSGKHEFGTSSRSTGGRAADPAILKLVRRCMAHWASLRGLM